MARFLRRQKRSRADLVRSARIPDRKERQFIENHLRIPIHKIVDAKDYLDVGSRHVWASFRACHLTANRLLSTTFRIQGQQTGAEVNSPELVKLLRSPNPFDSWEEILYQWTFHMKLTGNAFWLKDEMDFRGRPKHVFPLIPHYVRIIPHRTLKVAYYEYRVLGEVIRIERDEMIHFRRPHPSNVIIGMGDIEPSEPIYREYIMRGKMEERFLANGAMPSGVLMKKEEVDDEDEWAKIKKWWSSEYEGETNVGKTAFLNGEWSYQKLGLTHQEMQSIESEKWSVEQIFTNHGVPHSVAGLEKAANLATARQDEINFRMYEVVPLLDMLIGKLNGAGTGASGTFIQAFNPNWEIAYELSGLIDVQQVVKEYLPLVLVGGMSLNELRELMGQERKGDVGGLLDQHFVNQGRIPLELAGLSAPTDDQIKTAIAVNLKDLEAGGFKDDDRTKQFMEQLQAILDESFHGDEELGKDGWGELVMARLREAVAS